MLYNEDIGVDKKTNLINNNANINEDGWEGGKIDSQCLLFTYPTIQIVQRSLNAHSNNLPIVGKFCSKLTVSLKQWGKNNRVGVLPILRQNYHAGLKKNSLANIVVVWRNGSFVEPGKRRLTGPMALIENRLDRDAWAIALDAVAPLAEWAEKIDVSIPASLSWSFIQRPMVELDTGLWFVGSNKQQSVVFFVSQWGCSINV